MINGVFKTIALGMGLFVGWLSTAAAQTPAQPVARFEFSVMATERMRDIGFAQLKPEARSKPRPTAADYAIFPLRVSSQGRSDLYTHEGPLPLRIVATAAQDGEVRATRMLGVVTSQAIPPRTLLLLKPAGGGSDDLEVILLDDTPVGFPAQHVRIVNLSGSRVEGRLGDATFLTDPTRHIIAPQAVGDSVRIGVAYSRQGRLIPVFDQSLRVGSTERVMLVFLPPFRPGADVRVRVVRDSIRLTQSDGQG